MVDFHKMCNGEHLIGRDVKLCPYTVHGMHGMHGSPTLSYVTLKSRLLRWLPEDYSRWSVFPRDQIPYSERLGVGKVCDVAESLALVECYYAVNFLNPIGRGMGVSGEARRSAASKEAILRLQVVKLL